MKTIDLLFDLTRPNVMGILNVTPDSFSDGGQFNKPESAVRHVMKMVEDGVDIVDVGGESTRPGAAIVSIQEELDRTIPVIEAIRQESPVALSIDTSQPAVITEAAKAGVDLVNDVRALQIDGAVEAAAKTGLPVCLMHMQGQPENMQDNPSYDDVLQDIKEFFRLRIDACINGGIQSQQILLDPGFGFGKALEHNYRLLGSLQDLNKLKLPLLVGMSRKRMIAQVLNDCEPGERLFGSLAAAVLAVEKGAKVIRVHDVKATVDAMQVVKEMMKYAE